jgi:hypothetical protein
MYLTLTASSDAYITNKILNNNFRVTDANTGHASTLDLFKLYAESTSGSDDAPTELSRILVKFDYDRLRTLTGSTLDIDHSSFKCILKLYDVYGGQTTPSDFKIAIFPLSRSFDEGVGRDVVAFGDLGSVNFITSSISGDSAIGWNMTGANRQGLLGSNNLDIIASGNLNDGSGVANLWKEQTFSTGEEDLSIDITTVVSATLKNLIPDYGFRISYSGSHETDSKSRFVKRFASRHTQSRHKRPKITVTYDDAITDHTNMLQFDLTGSIFLNNFHRGTPSHILSGAAASEIKGDSCLVLRLTSGTFTKTVTGSQHKIGSSYVTGVYSASFAISQYTSLLKQEIINAGSASFKAYWGSVDYSTGYHTSSFVIKSPKRTSFNQIVHRLYVNVTNMKSRYTSNQDTVFRVFIEDTSRVLKAQKLPLELQSEVFAKMYYRVRDANTDEIVIPFHKNGTKLSSDSNGMYFEFNMSNLFDGRIYVFDFLIEDLGIDQTFIGASGKFRVDET